MVTKRVFRQIEQTFFLQPLIFSVKPVEEEGVELVGRLHTITEDEIRTYIRTKPYGDEPYFCTLDYHNYDPKAKFNAGYCVGHGHQYRLSLWSFMAEMGLIPHSKRWYNGEINLEDKNYYIYVSKASK